MSNEKQPGGQICRIGDSHNKTLQQSQEKPFQKGSKAKRFQEVFPGGQRTRRQAKFLTGGGTPTDVS
jgi:hypothetical protein